MPATRVRVVGSGFTTFNYRGKPIAFCEGVEDSGQRAFSDMGQGYQFIHPLGSRTPVEIATSRVLAGGTLMLTIRELWNAPVWNQLSELAGTQNIVDIFEQLAADPNYVQCQTIIKPPGTERDPSKWRGKTYHQCTIVDINDGDTIQVGSLAVTKGITVAYTYSTKLQDTAERIFNPTS
jgi:hypothetical protein